MTPHKFVVSIWALTALSSCAHAPSGATVPLPAKEAQAVTAPSTPPATPKLDAEQLLTRLLDLIRDSVDLQNFTPQRLQEAMETEVTYASNGDDRYGFGGPLTQHWSYGFGVDRSLATGPRFELSFNESPPGSVVPMTDICQVDFAQFTAELEAIGFTRNSAYDSPPQPPPGEPHLSHGQWMYDYFDRSGMRVEVYPEWETALSPKEGGRTCVKMVLIR